MPGQRSAKNGSRSVKTAVEPAGEIVRDQILSVVLKIVSQTPCMYDDFDSGSREIHHGFTYDAILYGENRIETT